MSEQELLCPWCGDLVDFEKAVEVRFTLTSGVGISMKVCPECRTVRPCPANVTGIHGEVFDDEYDGVRPPLPFEPDGQHGWCSLCAAPMEWSVERQRWVDYPVTVTPLSRLVRLMDRLDAGQLTQAEYDDLVADVSCREFHSNARLPIAEVAGPRNGNGNGGSDGCSTDGGVQDRVRPQEER